MAPAWPQDRVAPSGWRAPRRAEHQSEAAEGVGSQAACPSTVLPTGPRGRTPLRPEPAVRAGPRPELRAEPLLSELTLPPARSAALLAPSSAAKPFSRCAPAHDPSQCFR